MDFLKETLNRAKEAFDVAKQKTTEAVNVGKQKYDIASMENKLSKQYQKLGEACFNTIKDDDTQSEEIKILVGQIKAQLADIEQARAELLKMKNKRVCPKCAATVDDNAIYCNFCGEKLTYTE